MCCPDDLQLHERLQPRVAVHLLENVPEERCLNVAPDKPQHGDWYVYSYLHDLKRRRLWQRDGHSWRNYGLRKEKYRGRLLHKRYFRQINGSNLSRIVYELVGEHYLPRFLVQYIDDSRVPKGVAFMGGCSTNTSVTGRQRKHSIRKDALRRRLYTMLTDWQASELLVKTVKGSCCTTPANKPTNGYWYIFKYGQDQTRSDLWKDDGLQWVQHSSSAVHVGSRLLLKRQYIRYVEGSRVDFIRRSYEFVDPAAASLAGLGSLTAEQAVRQHTAEREASEAGETVTSEDVFAGDEDEADEFVGFDSSDPIDKRGAGAGGKSSSRLNGEASSNNGDKQKQRNSWKWSPTHSTNKEKKTPKLVIKEEETFDHHSSNSHDSPLSDLTDIAFNRVLVHYLGHDDAVDLPAPKPKKSTKSGGSRQAQVALCRAVPLTCTDGTLQTSNVGPNRGIHRRLHPREAAHLLEMTPQPDCIPYVPLPHPRAGLWCVLSGDLEDSSASSWSSDGYNWRLLSCLSLAVGDHSLLIKRYRRTVRGLGVHLYRYAYCLAHCDRARVLVHYIGLDDEPETFQSPDDFSGAPPVRCKEEGAVDETGFLDADTWPQVREEDYRHGRWQYLQDEEEQPDTSTVLNKDGLSVMVITRLLIPLEIATVIHLLEDTPEEDCLTFAPGNPKNGHWFVFTYAGLHPICQKGWKKDYYRWRHNGTHKRVIQDKNLNIRYYKRIVTGRGAHFMRYTYEILDEEGNNVLQRMLVHYLGRDDIPEPASSYSPKLRAKLGIGASVFVKVGDLMEGQYYTVMCSRFIPDLDVLPAEDPAEPPALGGSYGSVMEQQDHMFVDSQYGAIMKPRRSTKPRAIQSGIDKSNNFFLEEVLPSPDLPSCVVEEASSRYPSEEGDSSVDSGMPYVYRIGRSIIDMVYDFLYKIKETHSIFFQVIPTTIVVIACKSNMNEYKAMRVSSNANLVVYYDKTWKVDNLYVSSLYTKHIMCECETLFPLAFAIHELDDAPSHRTILEQMLQSCKALDSADTVILTDASPCLLSACAESLPKCIRASSWTNILEAVNLWFSRNEPTCDGWTITVDSVAKLLRTRSFDEYSLKYQEFSSTWVPQFRGFYDETLSDVVIASNAGSLQTLGMYSKHGLTITGLRDFLEQMGCLFTDVEVSSLEALTSMVYYVLYYYHNEIEKGKLKEVGTAFRRKRQFFSPMVKKRCFFPTRCALPEDVAGTILVKMKVPSFVAKKEPLQSFAIDEDDEETNVRELVNIEVDVDLDANNGIGEEEFEQITILETEPLGLKAEKITCVTETNEGEPLVYSQRSTDDEMDPAEHSFGRSKRPRLRLASDAVLFDQFDDDKSEDFIPGPVKRRGRPRKRKPSGILSPLKKPSMKRARKSDSYMRGGGKNLYDKRKKMVNLGHSLWASGRVSFDPGAETYFVSGARGAVECVKLSPAQHCSCGSRDRCKHVVAALLESLCADDAEEDKCLFTPARDRKPDFPTLLQSTTLDLQFEDDEFGTEETVFLEPSFDVDNDEI
ncbi:Zinc finger SWIM-type [Trinorchestia longiramus]|nr:Zinc finger SWIM-type [Trinorchestia longiramus]